MAIKYGKRRKHNSGTTRSSFNNKTGRTRHTTTTKAGGVTTSRSLNKGGSTRVTKTRKTAAGIERTTFTFGKHKKPKKQKVQKIPSFKPRKFSFFSKKKKEKKQQQRVSRRESSRESSGLSLTFWILFVTVCLILDYFF